jgi:protein-S-isoprenylcysteine O-methyltransferase Ste14
VRDVLFPGGQGTDMLMLLRAIAAFVALPGIVAFVLPILMGVSAASPAKHVFVAALLLGVGTCLLLWCVREFYVTGRGTLAPWDPPRHLVTTGPYRYSRNPMYIGVVTILVGWYALWALSALLIYTLCFAIGFHVRVLLFEEPWAARQFGVDWVAYRDRVPRWLMRRRSTSGDT